MSEGASTLASVCEELQSENPQGSDIPVGFGVLLEGESTAKENFGNLTVE